MSRKVSLDIGFGSCRESESVGIQRGVGKLRGGYGLWTIARKVAQVEPRSRDLSSHDGGGRRWGTKDDRILEGYLTTGEQMKRVDAASG